MEDILLQLWPYEVGLKGYKGDEPTFVFYRNGTYRVDDWDNDELSQWEIKDGVLWVFHRQGGTVRGVGQGRWLECSEGEIAYGRYVVERLEMELAMRKVLGDEQ